MLVFLGLIPTTHAVSAAAEAETNLLSKIGVTAEKRLEKLQDVPIDVTVALSSLENRGARQRNPPGPAFRSANRPDTNLLPNLTDHTFIFSPSP